MKYCKTSAAILAVAMIVAASACAPTSRAAGNADEPALQPLGKANVGYTVSVEVFTDPDTQCQYLLNTAPKMGGITPRLDVNGAPICGNGFVGAE